MSLAAAFLSLIPAEQLRLAGRTGARLVAIGLLAVLLVVVDGPVPLTVGLLAFAAGNALLEQGNECSMQISGACMVAGTLLI